MITDKYRKRVYCSIQFLKELAMLLFETTYNVLSYKELNYYVSISELLLSSKIVLIINVSSKEYKNIKNSYKNSVKKGRTLSSFEKLIHEIEKKRDNHSLTLLCSDTEKDVPYIDICKDKIEGEALNAIFFTCAEKSVCEEVIKQYGVLVICFDNIKDFDYLFSDKGQAVYRNEHGNWKQLLSEINIKGQNSIILVDNHAIKCTFSLENNIFDIIDILLQQPLDEDVPLQISIFSSFKEKDLKWKEVIYSKLINHYIEKNVIISMFKIEDTIFHDRVLITNNLWISCGYGFDLFKACDNVNKDQSLKRADKSTTLSIVSPFFNNNVSWAYTAYENIINEIKRLLPEMEVYNDETLNEYTTPNKYVGSLDNRIYSQCNDK